MLLWNKLRLTVGPTNTRVRVIEELSHSKGPAAVLAVVEMALRDQTPEVQVAAARALGRLKDPHGVTALAGLLQRGVSEVQVAAAQALGEMANASATGSLVALLDDPVREVRQAVTEALARVGEPAVPHLLQALRHNRKEVRDGAQEALARIGLPAVAALLEALRDGESPVRRAATEVLVQVGPPAVAPLSEALCQEGDPVRLAAAEALGRIGDPAAAEALVEALRSSVGGTRLEAARALHALGWAPADAAGRAEWAVALRDWQQCAALGAAAVDPLIDALAEDDVEVRDGAAEVLAGMGPTVVAALLNALHGPSPLARGHAALALGFLQDERSVGPLVAALKGEDGAVRENALLALWRIGGPRAAGALIEALGDEDRLLRFRAARALEAIGDERAVEPLAEVAAADDYVRPAAALALARLAPARAVEPLARLAADGFAAEEAVAALTRVLEAAAGDITPDDLLAVAQLHGEEEDAAGRPGAFAKAVDCSRVAGLAREELARRGLSAAGGT
jgi:HEAT repeat protein